MNESLGIEIDLNTPIDSITCIKAKITDDFGKVVFLGEIDKGGISILRYTNGYKIRKQALQKIIDVIGSFEKK